MKRIPRQGHVLTSLGGTLVASLTLVTSVCMSTSPPLVLASNAQVALPQQSSRLSKLRPLTTSDTPTSDTPTPSSPIPPSHFVELPPTSYSGPPIVAMIDSAVDSTHPTLSAALLPEINLMGGTNKASLEHGTAVASVIHASDPAALILPISVLDDTELSNQEAVAAAVYAAVGRGVSVINISLGSETLSPDDSPMAAAVRYAIASDVVVVAAAGNDGDAGSNLMIPAAYDGVIAVGAHTARGKIASFSNRGYFLDVTALGASVVVATPGGGFKRESGTSLAAPFVAGLASALRRAHPDWSAKQVSDHILATSHDAGAPGPDPVYGFGRVDAARALSSELLSPFGEVPQLAAFSGLKIRRAAGGVQLSSRGASRIFVQTPEGEKLEVGPSGSYLRVKKTAPFLVWSYDRTGTPTLPTQHVLRGSKAPRLKASATFKRGLLVVEVSSKVPAGLSVSASATSPDDTLFMTYSSHRRFEVWDRYVPHLEVCLTTEYQSFACRIIPVRKLS